MDDAWTREEFEGYLEKLSKLEGVKWPIDTFRGYGIKTEWITYAYSPILQSAGCDLIDRKAWTSVGTLDSKPCVDALAMMQKWVKSGWVVPQSSGTNQFYAEGHPAALALGGHWVYAEAAASMKDDVVVMPLPKFGLKGASPNGTFGPIANDKPVKVSMELPAELHRDLTAYAEVLARETGQPVGDAVRLIVPMLERFIASDRGFAKARRISI